VGALLELWDGQKTTPVYRGGEKRKEEVKCPGPKLKKEMGGEKKKAPHAKNMVPGGTVGRRGGEKTGV